MRERVPLESQCNCALGNMAAKIARNFYCQV